MRAMGTFGAARRRHHDELAATAHAERADHDRRPGLDEEARVPGRCVAVGEHGVARPRTTTTRARRSARALAPAGSVSSWPSCSSATSRAALEVTRGEQPGRRAGPRGAEHLGRPAARARRSGPARPPLSAAAPALSSVTATPKLVQARPAVAAAGGHRARQPVDRRGRGSGWRRRRGGPRPGVVTSCSPAARAPGAHAVACRPAGRRRPAPGRGPRCSGASPRRWCGPGTRSAPIAVGSVCPPSRVRSASGAVIWSSRPVGQRHRCRARNRSADLQAEPGPGQRRLDREHVADLLPAGLHHVLLELAHHLGAEAGGDPAPGVEC